MERLNEVFVEWLTEWYKEAQNQNLKSRFALKKAIDSIQNYNEGLFSAKDAGKLSGIGEKLVAKLKLRLQQRNPSSSQTSPDFLSSQAVGLSSQQASGMADQVQGSSPSQPLAGSPEKPKSKRRRNPNAYVPKYRSGAYAILCALGSGSGVPMTKDEIISKGQIHCDVSFLVPQSSFQYTAWSSIKGLVERELVYKHGMPAVYELSEQGKELAQRLVPSLSQQQEPNSDCLNSTDEASIQIMEAGSYEVCCLVDTRERQDQSNRGAFLTYFRAKNLAVASETLEVGDFMWVAKPNDASSSNRVVLDVVVERKRHDDFVSSLTTNRLQEQSHRLARSGVKRVIYLLEAYRNQPIFEDFGMSRISSAIFELQTTLGFTVKYTKGPEESCAYLHRIHELLMQKYANQPISYYSANAKDVIPSDDEDIKISFVLFQGLNSKSVNLALRDIFTRQLLCIKGMTAEKALLIVQKYSTIQQLKRAYLACPTEKAKFTLISELTNQKIKPKLSKQIFLLFCGM